MKDSKKRTIKSLLFDTEDIVSLILGIFLALVLMFLSKLIADSLDKVLVIENPVSMIMIAIVLGLIVRNTLKLSVKFNPGISFGLRKLLQLGIILLGIRLSIYSVLKISITAAGLVAVCIASALAITIFLSGKIGVSDKLGTLIAAGTSICGASAIVATAPTIEAEEEETAYAIATITIFGLIVTIVYPYLVEWVLHLSPEKAGFFLGTSVHETAQVTATAFIYDQLWNYKLAGNMTGGDIAITVKLIRSTFMIAVIPFLGFWFARKQTKTAGNKENKIRILKYIPVFVIGYLIMAAVRSTGDAVFGTNDYWTGFWKFTKTTAGYVITTFIACIGLSTDIKKLVELSLKPFLSGLIASSSVGAVSLFLILLFGSFLRF